MKLVIYTQIRENYAAHNGFTGENHWKCKGGETYIVPNLTAEHVRKIKDKGIPTLASLIEDLNESFEEYIIDYVILEDDAKAHEDYEAPYILKYLDGKWVSTRVQEGRDWGFHESIVSCTKTYTMVAGGEKEDFKTLYTLVDGRTMDREEFISIQKA